MPPIKKTLIILVLIIGFGYYTYRIRLDPPDKLNTLFIEPEKANSRLQQNSILNHYNYIDGEYLGEEFHAFYGNVQVRVTILNGDIVDVDVLEYPKHHSYSRQINPDAVQQLTKKTLAVQSEEIDIVTGATQTSKGYIYSLQTALEQAKNQS